MVRHERADLSSATDLHRRRTLSGAVYRATIALGLLLPAPLHTSRRLKYSPPERPELRGDSARTCTGLVASNRHSIGGCGHQHLFGSGVSVTQASSARILSMSK